MEDKHNPTYINPVSEFIDKFLMTKTNNRPATQMRYYVGLQMFYRITNTDIVTEESLNVFLNFNRAKLLEKQIGEKTFNNYLSLIKTYTHWLRRRGIIKDDSFLIDYKGISNPETSTIKKYYTEEEVQEFLKVRPRWLHYFLFLGFYYGFRPNEISRLNTNDIHLEERYIHVRPNVQKVKKTNYLAIPNIFHDKFYEILRWRSRQETKSKFLLINRFGDQITRATIEYHLQKLRKIDPMFKYYHMRYTAAWRAYKLTKNLYAAQQLLRHTNPSQTVEYLGIQKEEMLSVQRQDMKMIFAEVSL